MSTNDSTIDKDAWPTPDRDVPGVSDLSQFDEGDRLRMEGHQTPLTVLQVGVREVELATGETTRQYAVAATHDRSDAVEHELIEQINLVDGTTLGVVDDRGCPVRVFAGSD